MRKILPLISLSILALIFSSCGEEEKTYQVIGEENIPFIGDNGNGMKVFVYELGTGATHVFNGIPPSQPVLITGSGEGGRYYFVTGTGYNSKESYFDTIKVYIHSYSGTKSIFKSLKVSKIYANILDANTLNLVLYHLELVNQRIYKDNYMIDSTGRILTKQKESYNLLEGEIPEVPSIKINNKPPDGLHTLTIDKKEKNNRIILTGNKTPKGKLILETDQSIDRVYWTPDKEKVILLTSNLDVHKTDEDTSSTLMVYSLEKTDYIARFSGIGYRNFSIKKDLLLFDDNENGKRFIRIFDLNKMKDAGRIKMKNGCSIRFLPYY